MYVKKGKKLSIEEVKDFLEKKNVSDVTSYDIGEYARQFVEINEILLGEPNGRIYGLCEKCPSNLDRGNHYYSIIYVSSNGTLESVYMPKLRKLIGAYVQNKRRNIPYFGFKSRAIGMNRLLDATDGFFDFLRNMGGCYAQINVW